MSDDLGRGLLRWAPERWQALDKIANEAVATHAVFRTLIEQKTEPGAVAARIGDETVPITTEDVEIKFDVRDERDEDLERKVRKAGQQLAAKEDAVAVNVIGAKTEECYVVKGDLGYEDFIEAKNELKGRGIGIVASTAALTKLEVQAVGVRSGLEVVERVTGARVVDSESLPPDMLFEELAEALEQEDVEYLEKDIAVHKGAHWSVHAFLFQASPAAFRMARAWGPRLRVTGIEGTKVTLKLEEGLAVGQLEEGRSIKMLWHGRRAAMA